MELMRRLNPDVVKTLVIAGKIVIILYFMNSKLTVFAYQNF